LVFGQDGFGDADLGDLHRLVVDCLVLHYPLRTAGSIRLASLFPTVPTRVLTGQQVISSARWSTSKVFKPHSLTRRLFAAHAARDLPCRRPP
jgi:hypothetical protein